MYFNHRKRQGLWLYICIPENITTPEQVHVVYAKNKKACLEELAASTKNENIKWKLKVVTLRGLYNKVYEAQEALIKEVEDR